MSRGWLVCLLLLFCVPATEQVAAAPDPWAQPPVPSRPPPAAPPPALSRPAPEIGDDATRVDLPAIPRFALPRLPDDLHGPLEILVAGSALRGTRIRVAGYITWIYDCAAALAGPKKTRAQIQRMIDEDPTMCERPKFYLGDARKTEPDHSLWVVDVPRRPFKIEKERLPAAELANWPAVPKLAVGAYVVVTGTLALESPHRERNSDGLLVYEAIEFPRAPPSATSVAMPDATLPPVPKIPPAVKSMAPVNGNQSIRHLNAGNRAYTNKQYQLAMTEYEAAIQAWDGNHAAWYGLAGARAQGRDFAGSAAAAERCVALVPDAAMYWLLRGRMLYEATIQEARTQEASRQNLPPERVTIDVSKLDFTPALQALLVAAQLENKLWRAHYYIGRIHHDRGEAKAAAERLTRTLALHATDPGPYLALCELYRRWQYRDEALAIAELGVTLLPNSSELWFEVGMVHDERGDAGKAIDGFTRALDLRPDSGEARFQRGQAYFRKKDVAHARADLEAFVELRKDDPGSSFEAQQARTMLAAMKR